MRLYHYPLSGNAPRAVLTALHLLAPVEFVFVDLVRGDQRRPEFLKMNPNGWVPVLDDDGFYLHESHAIMQYLADGTPGQTVYPTDRRARADVNRWLFWCAQHFQPAVGLVRWERVIKARMGQGGPDEDAVKRGDDLVARLLPVLDGQLEHRRWVTGNTVTLADLSLAATLSAAEQAKIPVSSHSNLLAWFE